MVYGFFFIVCLLLKGTKFCLQFYFFLYLFFLNLLYFYSFYSWQTELSSKAKCQRRLYPYKHGSVCIWGNASSASVIRGEISVCKYVGLCMSHMWEAVEGIVLNSKLEEKNSLLVTLFSWNVCRQAESGRVYLHTITLPNTCWSCMNSMILKLYIHCKKNSAIWNLKLSLGKCVSDVFFGVFLISNLSLIFLPLIKLWRFFATWRDHVSVIVHFEFLDNTVSPAIAFGRYPMPPVWPIILPWSQRGEQKTKWWIKLPII